MTQVYKIITLAAFFAVLVSCNNEKSIKKIELSPEELQDKIKGGWAGQTIGVVYGAPTEFKFQGTTIQDYQPIPWDEHIVRYWWDKKPGLFDDIYNDLTFVDVFEKYGVDAPIDTIAYHFAYAEYHLAHANQAARYNIRQGIMPPASGHWLNNPHADDLDFQIEADFIGLMAPGMVNAATEVADRVGHIMNSGDGWYGGVFVSALYSLAFTTKNVEELVEKSLITIPKESTFYQCISDVLMWYKKYPNDWMATWYELHKKWNVDVGCPKGVFLSFNIDAKINSAYVAIGLLYGKGDFSKSIDISTRCGQDSDCNPATVGGVLGVMNGYSNIPDFWLNPLKEIEHLNFEGTTVSLNKAYDLSYKHSLEMVKKNGGEVQENKITIIVEEPKPVALEQNFINTYPTSRQKVDLFTSNEYNFDFTGNGFVIYGNLIKTEGIKESYLIRVANRFGSEIFALAELSDSYVANLDVYIDGKLDHKVVMPMKNSSRRLEPAWKYQLEDKEHKVKVVWTNPKKGYSLRINDLIIYSSSPATPNFN